MEVCTDNGVTVLSVPTTVKGWRYHVDTKGSEWYSAPSAVGLYFPRMTALCGDLLGGGGNKKMPHGVWDFEVLGDSDFRTLTCSNSAD